MTLYSILASSHIHISRAHCETEEASFHLLPLFVLLLLLLLLIIIIHVLLLHRADSLAADKIDLVTRLDFPNPAKPIRSYRD